MPLIDIWYIVIGLERNID